MTDNPRLLDPRLKFVVLAKRAKEALLKGDPRPIVELHWPGTILDDFQIDIIRSLFDPKFCEIAVKGCAGAGKGAAVAIGVNLWLHSRSSLRNCLNSAGSRAKSPIVASRPVSLEAL